MKDLLTAIKSAIKDRLNYLPANAVFLAAHENILPGYIRQIGVGIKDGPINRRELAAGMMEVTSTVNIILWSGWIDDDARLLGGTMGRGLLELAADIHELLDENDLGITGVISAFSPSEMASEPYGNESRAMQRKVITYQYVKEEERP